MDEILQPAVDPNLYSKLDNHYQNHSAVLAPTDNELMQVSGAFNISSFPILSPNGDWTSLIPDFIPQTGVYFDTDRCNLFSSVHGLTCVLNALNDSDYYNANNKPELSERKVCIDVGGSNTTGTSEYQWEQASSANGMVKETTLPYPWQQRDPVFTWEDFLSGQTPEIKAEGKKFLDKYDIFHRQIGTDLNSIKEALKYAPVKIFVAWGSGWNSQDPQVIPPNNNPMQHAVMVRKVSELGTHIYDQYSPYLKLLDPNYKIYYAFQTLIKPKGGVMPNTYLIVGDNGQGGQKEGVCLDFGNFSQIVWAKDAEDLKYMITRYQVSDQTVKHIN